MNILIYAPRVSKKWGGIYQYTESIISILSEDTTNHYYVYINNDQQGLADLCRDLPHITIIPESIPHSYFPYIWKALINLLPFSKRFIPKKFDRIVRRYKIDIIHSTYNEIPVTDCKTIISMHDLQEEHYPAFFSTKERIYRSISHRFSIVNATRIIVSFSHVKEDIKRIYHQPDSKIYIRLLNMKKLWFQKYTPADVDRSFTETMPAGFLLYPAAVWEHKNHLNLIRAIIRLKEEHMNIPLICTGNHNLPYFNNVIRPLIEQHQLQDQVKFLGIIPEKELYSLYKTARCVIVPTLYEAGSFPVVESLYLGAPVICSNVTSLPETIGNNDFVFDPHDPGLIADKIRRVYADEVYYQQAKINVQEQLALFMKKESTLSDFTEIYDEMTNS
jgi:glycosyltransferase involved in cell wall biosynthesis